MARNNEKNIIRLPLNGDDQHLEVGLNGTMYMLKRGEEIQVNNALLEILENSGLVTTREGSGKE